ncbi:MAG: hypothetical protein NC189_05950 [Bacteroides sp.]|nr:hypothetical protein [Bacteroides sp.]
MSTKVTAQTDAPVKLPGQPTASDSVPTFMLPVTTPEYPPATFSDEQIRTLRQVEHTLALPSVFAPAPTTGTSHERTVSAPGFAGFNLWQGGMMFATGSSFDMPGLMGVETGQIGFSQQFGNFSFQAYATASHYGYFRGLQTVYGFGGSLSYRVSNSLSLTMFGAYATGSKFISPALAGYMSVPTFGGYASIDLNEHWGVNVGAQASRSPVTNRWEAQPIVMPYYKINGKAAVGVDVGGILYNIIQTANSHRHHANPTMGPPGGRRPPVAPRPK